jgi:polyisoprenoid-binding protein YceI
LYEKSYNMFAYSLLIIAALSFILTLFLKNKRFIFLLLPGVALTHFALDYFESDPSVPMIQITFLAALGLALLTNAINGKIWRFSGLIIAMVFAIPIGAKANFGSFELVWSSDLLLLSVFGAAIPLVSALISGKLFPAGSSDSAETWIALLLASPMFMFANFQASLFGAYLLFFSWLIAAIAKRSVMHSSISFGGMIIICALIYASGQSLVSTAYLAGNWWMGFAAGMGAMGWFGLLDSKRFKFLHLLFLLVLLNAFVLFGFVNEHFGGLTALVGALVGLGVGLWLPNNSKQSFSALVLPLVLILLIPVYENILKPKTVVKKSVVEREQTEQSQTEKKAIDLPSFETNAKHGGTWKSLAAYSSLNFELGPKGSKTQGAFKTVNVRMNLDDSGFLKELKVNLNSKDLTTFNDLRDESVLGDGYIKADKFPQISYQSKSIQRKGDRYVVTGELELLGFKKQVDLEMKCIAEKDVDGKNVLVFVGNGELNRTFFGMKSDSKIGDVVHLDFEITLNH